MTDRTRKYFLWIVDIFQFSCYPLHLCEIYGKYVVLFANVYSQDRHIYFFGCSVFYLIAKKQNCLQVALKKLWLFYSTTQCTSGSYTIY